MERQLTFASESGGFGAVICNKIFVAKRVRNGAEESLSVLV